MAAPVPQACGLHLPSDENGEGGVRVVAGAGRKTLQVGTVKTPFELKPGRNLTRRMFVDKVLVEVFANDRQAVTFTHGHVRREPNIRLFAEGGDLTARAKAWKMTSIYTRP